MSIGEKLEEFYLSLSEASLRGSSSSSSSNDTATRRLADAVNQLERHALALEANDDAITVLEIVKDCRKKAAQILRTPYAEAIRNLVAACRKRLVSKAALDNESSQQHGQRHLNTLIELLGTWSNIVQQCLSNDFSPKLIQLILSPLYTRLLEAAFECFRTFKVDKELEQWNVRLLEKSNTINLPALDFLITQVSTMREIVHQHYSFLYSSFYPILQMHYSLKQEDALPPTPPSVDINNRIAPPVVKQSNVTSVAEDNITPMLVVSPEEFMQWRELEALYVALEFGFITRSVAEAYNDVNLIEVEHFAFVPQCVEDAFFLLMKVSERAISTGSESCIFSIGNKVIEALVSSEEELDPFAVLWRLMKHKQQLFKHCRRHVSLQRFVMNQLLYGDAAGKAPSSALTPGKQVAGMPPTGGSDGQAMDTVNSLSHAWSQSSLSQLWSTGGEENGNMTSGFTGNELDASALASTALTGVNQWLVGQLSPYLSNDDGIAAKSEVNDATTTTPQTNRSTTSRNGLPPTSTGSRHLGANVIKTPGATGTGTVGNSTSTMSIDELLLNALESDAGTKTHVEDESYNNYDYFYNGYFYNSSTGTLFNENSEEISLHAAAIPKREEEHPLKGEDWIIYINTLATISVSVQKLLATYDSSRDIVEIYRNVTQAAATNDAVGKSNSTKDTSTIQILLRELSQCSDQYHKTLESEIRSFVETVYAGDLRSGILKFCGKRYDITGQEMEDRSNDRSLSRIICSCLHHTIDNDTTDYSELLQKKKIITSSTNLTKPSSGSSKQPKPPSDNGHGPNSGSEGPQQTAVAQYGGCGYLQRIYSTTRLCHYAYLVFLMELSRFIVNKLVNDFILKTKFSEWGALLVHQEVLHAVSYIESLMEALDVYAIPSLKDIFEILFLSIKVITLDAPSDIRRYSFPVSLMTEEQVRQLMDQRIEFSKEAVAKVRINMIND